MMTAAGVLSVTAFRRVQPGHHLVAGGSRRESLDFRQEIVGERLTRVRRPGLELPMQRVGYIAALNHSRHVTSMLACVSHVDVGW
jgi:hypothetical protein